jgi:hypothetical protein
MLYRRDLDAPTCQPKFTHFMLLSKMHKFVGDMGGKKKRSGEQTTSNATSEPTVSFMNAEEEFLNNLCECHADYAVGGEVKAGSLLAAYESTGMYGIVLVVIRHGLIKG